MPTIRRSRTLPATPEQLWQVIGDPHHLPRWWPRVSRVEGVDDDAFTEVLAAQSGKAVRADFRLLEERRGERVVWAQDIDGTPFARVLRSAETEIALLPIEPTIPGARPLGGKGDSGTEVTIELRQTLRGLLARLGAPLVRRAAANTIEQALDGLERIFG